MSEEQYNQEHKPGNGHSTNPDDVKTSNLQHISHTQLK